MPGGSRGPQSAWLADESVRSAVNDVNSDIDHHHKTHLAVPYSWKLGPQPHRAYERMGPYWRPFQSTGPDPDFVLKKGKTQSRNAVRWDAKSPEELKEEARLRALVKKRNKNRKTMRPDGTQVHDAIIAPNGTVMDNDLLMGDPFVGPLVKNSPAVLDKRVAPRTQLAEKLLEMNVPAAKRTHLHHLFGGGNVPSAPRWEPLSTEARQSFRYTDGYKVDVQEKQTQFSREYFLKRNNYTEFNEARLRYAKLHNVT